ITSVNIGIMSGNDFLLSSALLLGSGFAIYTVIRVGSRQRLLKAGLFVAAVMSVLTFAVSLIGGAPLTDSLRIGALGLANGLLSLGLAMVLLPFLEDAFNILTPMKLLELSNPSNPLLHKLLQKAPGTFAHSMQVGNLAENAAERIGANALLARVGAYYHDIGKMEHPAYYIENQIARVNPHANLSPTLSAKIIKRHVKDGLEIGRAWGLPQEILDIIAQHHGTTRIEYFYRKALEESVDGTEVNEADFRYNTGLPRSKEAGIMMLADSVEATVKALSKPTPKRIEDVVRETIKRKMEDGQFDECELTMREIHQVGDAIREALIGFLGPRIEYPDDSRSSNGVRPADGEAPKPATRTAGDTT
ncbi:MAG: HDIG domain-containing metalloprotein, partial [Actinomycetota bacterium]